MHLTITMTLKSILKVSMAILKRSEFAKQIFYALGSNKLSAYCRDKIIYGVLGIGAGNNYDWIFDFIDVNNSRGKVLIEIGSRDALDCLSLMKKTECSHAYVFEPSIRNLPKCIANILKTKVRNQITLFPIAIGKQILHTNPMGLQLVNFQETSIPGMSSIYPLKSPEQKYPGFLSYHTPGKVIDSYLVPITPLDFLLNYIESDIFLLAIDVEGAEWDVIEGGKESLKITHYLRRIFNR